MPRQTVFALVILLSLPGCGGSVPTESEQSVNSPGFEIAGRMTTTRFWHFAVQLQSGQVLFSGGAETDRPGHSSPAMMHNSSEIFDPESGKSDPSGNLTQARQGDKGILLRDGRVVLIGSPGQLVEIYDPQTRRFSATAYLPMHGHPRTVTLLQGGGVFVSDERGNTTVFNPDTGEFSSVKRMISSRDSHTATLLEDGRVLISGGRRGGQMIKGSEIYDPVTNSFKAVGDLNNERFGHKAILLQDGRVLIIGGSRVVINSGDVQHVLTAEFFDIDTETFSPGGNTAIEAIRTAFLMPTGKVFTLSPGEVVLYDPATGTSTRTGHSIASNRDLYTVTMLNDGRVLVSGGWNDLESTDEILIYTP